MSGKTVASVLAMLLIGATSVLYLVNTGLNVSALTTTRSASFIVPESNGLLVGSRVLMRGVSVGSVSGIHPVSNGVEITWTYGADVPIPADSAFRIDNLSALGEAYVGVVSSTEGPPYLTDGARIASERVTVPTSFNELSARLTTLLRQVDPAQVGKILTTLDAALPDDRTVIDDLDAAGRLLADELGRQSDSLTTLLSTLQPLLARTGRVPGALAQTTPQLNGFGAGFTDMLNSIRDAIDLGGPLFVGVTDGANPFLAELQSFLDKTSKDLNVIGVNLLPAVRAGAAALSTVDIGRVLTLALAATSERGALTVRIPTG